MPATKPRSETSMPLAADLDAGTVTAAHEQLLSLLDAVETSEAGISLDLESGDGVVSPLSLQLLASAARSFPAVRLSFGPHAAAALAALEQSKEI